MKPDNIRYVIMKLQVELARLHWMSVKKEISEFHYQNEKDKINSCLEDLRNYYDLLHH